MESQNIEFRAVIKFLTKESAKAKEIHRHMADVYGDSSPKYSTVAKGSAEFKRGRDSLEDDQRPGRPADVISQEMINRVEGLVLNNRRIKVVELASECGFSNGSVYTIIHEHLGKSICQVGTQKPEHARSLAKGGVKSRTSGSVQCQSIRLSRCKVLLMRTHNMFLRRTGENYTRIIIKYFPITIPLLPCMFGS